MDGALPGAADGVARSLSYVGNTGGRSWVGEGPVAARLFVEETRRFGELYDNADWSAPVPTCGQWTAAQVFRHVGRGNRWAAKMIADRATEELDPRTVPDGRPPDDRAGALDWLHAGATLLVDAVDEGPDVEVWTFNGPRPAHWWVRRRLHETLVHRADAALALGADFDPAPEVAADCLTEWLELKVEDPASSAALDEGCSVHLHASDDGLGESGEWTIRCTADGITWEHGHDKGTVALRGSARDLLLAITRRASTDDLDIGVFGDRTVWDGWLDRTPF